MVDYGDDIEFDPKAGTFKELVMLHFNRVVKFMSVEFRGGYFTIVPSKEGDDKEIYIPDTREIYSNAVLALALLLIPRYDKDMEKEYKEYNENITKITTTFIDASAPTEEIVLGDSFYDNEKDRLLLETYKQQKLQHHLLLFKACSELLGRKNYLDIGGKTF